MSKLLDSSGCASRSPSALARRPAGARHLRGLILLAPRGASTAAPTSAPLGVLDVTVRRNGYGRQRDSFEATLDVDGLAGGPFPGVFIRAPASSASATAVEVLARARRRIPCSSGRAASGSRRFHPELSGDLRLHQLLPAAR